MSMKKIILLLLLPLFCTGQSEEKIEYWESGQVLSQIHYLDGKRNGLQKNITHSN